MSSSHMNVYSGDPQVTASLVGVTSSSCPAELTQKRELTGTSPDLGMSPALGLVPDPRARWGTAVAARTLSMWAQRMVLGDADGARCSLIPSG